MKLSNFKLIPTRIYAVIFIIFVFQIHQTLQTYLKDRVWDFHFYVTKTWPEQLVVLHFPGMTQTVSIPSQYILYVLHMQIYVSTQYVVERIVYTVYRYYTYICVYVEVVITLYVCNYQQESSNVCYCVYFCCIATFATQSALCQLF